MRTQKSGMSPYQRHRKAPYLYSSQLQNLITALKEGKGVDRAREAHNSAFPLGPAVVGLRSPLPRKGRHIMPSRV